MLNAALYSEETFNLVEEDADARDSGCVEVESLCRDGTVMG
jgi:hypothetical protein